MSEAVAENPVDDIFSVLDRRQSIHALDALASAIEGSSQDHALSETAIGIDTNVFLRIADHAQSDLIIDYLSSLHTGPLILPGQAIQEFWNNHAETVANTGSKLRTNFNNLKRVVDGIEDDFGDFVEKMETLLGEFNSDHGHVYDSATIMKTGNFLNILKDRASVPFAPRLQFHELAQHRKRTKTPPGFKDAGDGDFFVWIDFLLGLRQAQLDGSEFSKCVLVTNDTKKDWSRGNSAHPILVAEAKAVLGAQFETWTLKTLVTKIEQATD